MKPDQRNRLEALQEKIAEVLIEEMNPDNWAGAGIIPALMDKEQRGNRYFDKKNAAMTAVIYMDNAKLLENTKAALGRDPYKDNELDKKIQKAEQDADKLLESVRKTAGKTHGKPAQS